MRSRSLILVKSGIDICRRTFSGVGNGWKPPFVPNDLDVHRGTVAFRSGSGVEVEVETAWQDTQPSGSSIGTVVSMHGSPGSHNDFKYITNELRTMSIRHVGLNFPGFTYTEAHESLDFVNDERDSYVTGMMNKLGLDRDIVWLGHSRGCENALRSAVKHASNSRGLVLANFTGYKIHKGIRPNWLIQWAANSYRRGGVSRAVAAPITFYAYERLGLKTGSPKIAGHCVRTMQSFELKGMRRFVGQFNKLDHLQALMLIGGRDFLIEQHISEEFFNSFDDGVLKRVEPSPIDEEEASRFALERIVNGNRATGVLFPRDGHFMQKFRCRLIAQACKTMLDSPGQK